MTTDADVKAEGIHYFPWVDGEKNNDQAMVQDTEYKAKVYTQIIRQQNDLSSFAKVSHRFTPPPPSSFMVAMCRDLRIYRAQKSRYYQNMISEISVCLEDNE